MGGQGRIGAALIGRVAGDRPMAMWSPWAVARQHQRCGSGGALVREATARADADGEPLVVLEGSPAYYPKFGFEPARPHGIEIPLPDWAPEEAGQVILLAGYDPTDTTLRGAVVYPAAFDGVD